MLSLGSDARLGGGWLRRALIAIALTLAAATSCSLLAADTDDFDVQAITIDGKIMLTLPAQFDGVGGKELIVLTRTEQRGRRLTIYRELTPKSMQPVAPGGVEIPKSVFAIQTIDIDNDRREEIVLLGLESLFVVDFDGGGFNAVPTEVAKFERLFGVPTPEFITEYEFLFDLNGDNLPEAVLPAYDGVRILKRDRAQFTAVKSPKIEHRCAGMSAANLMRLTSAGEFAVGLPTIRVEDVNGDRARDLLVASGAGLSVLHQLGDMQFADNPNQFLEVRAVFLENLRFTSWALADLNGDKMADYARIFTQGERDEFKTVLEVFLANAQLGYPSRPSRRIVLNQYALGLDAVDLNGDGAASLIVATTSISSTALVKALLVSRIGIELSIFETENGVMPELAKSIKKVNCPIDFFGNGLPSRYIGCLHGDLDRDRLNDLIVLNDDDELQVFKGGPNPHFSDKPVITRQAPRVVSLDAHDINDDGKADLIVVAGDEDGRQIAQIMWTK